jgi:hypothetical protein
MIRRASQWLAFMNGKKPLTRECHGLFDGRHAAAKLQGLD